MTGTTGAAGAVTTPKIAVVFYSATANVAALAEAVARAPARRAPRCGCARCGARAAQAIASNPRWQTWVDTNPYEQPATLDDLDWADGIALGSPTRFGGPAGQLKEFLDTTGGSGRRAS